MDLHRRLQSQPRVFRDHRLTTLAMTILVPAIFALRSAPAQSLDPGSPASIIDAYGNAQPPSRPRRPLSVFENEAQRKAVELYQRRVRRTQFFDGTWGFGPPGSLPVPGQPGYFLNPGAGYAPRRPADAGRMASAQYGGFGARPAPSVDQGIDALLSRRSALVAGSGPTMSVYRGLDRPWSGSLAAPRVEDVPFVPSESDAATVSAVALDRSLHLHAEQAFLKARADAWQWFHDGRYRQAARAFETARFLEPSDPESRLGEIVCYFALGAGRSAMVALRQLPRAVQNPVAIDLNLAQRFGRREEWRRVRVETQLLAELPSPDPDVAALRSLLLWHFGERGEAVVVAAAIAKEHPASPFADWATQMRSISDAGRDTAPAP